MEHSYREFGDAEVTVHKTVYEVMIPVGKMKEVGGIGKIFKGPYRVVVNHDTKTVTIWKESGDPAFPVAKDLNHHQLAVRAAVFAEATKLLKRRRPR